MVMGIAEVCRREDICNMAVDNIEDNGSVIVVRIPNTKTITLGK